MIGAIGVFACLYFTFTQLLPIGSRLGDAGGLAARG